MWLVGLQAQHLPLKGLLPDICEYSRGVRDLNLSGHGSSTASSNNQVTLNGKSTSKNWIFMSSTHSGCVGSDFIFFERPTKYYLPLNSSMNYVFSSESSREREREGGGDIHIPR